MKKLIIGAALAIAAMSTPAMASDFTGARVGVTAGFDKQADQEGVALGGVAGYDVAVVGPVRAGVEVTVADSTANLGPISSNLDLGANLRAGVKVLDRALAFGKVGYARTDFTFGGLTATQEGVRFGGGVEYAVTDRVFTTVEYDRTEYGNIVPGRDRVLATVGFRF
jgi:outer membrane immunogenic protein